MHGSEPEWHSREGSGERGGSRANEWSVEPQPTRHGTSPSGGGHGCHHRRNAAESQPARHGTSPSNGGRIAPVVAAGVSPAIGLSFAADTAATTGGSRI